MNGFGPRFDAEAETEAMPLAAGTSLGHYTITAPLGAGGMGEVYRARDKKLGREVSLLLLENADDPRHGNNLAELTVEAAESTP